MRTILLLEDDESLNRGISFVLRKEGYTVHSCTGTKEGRVLFANNPVDLIICDITLQDGNGLAFCEEIRKRSKAHFIFLTALDQETDIIMGYEVGADDYITKPFSLTVLISKVNSIYKRLDGEIQDIIRSGDVEYIKNEMKVYVSGKEKVLTKNELKLLLLFMEHPKQILSKSQILENLFDINGDFVDENTIAVNIRRLREKIEEEPSNPIYIKNIRGIGYIWNQECYLT